MNSNKINWQERVNCGTVTPDDAGKTVRLMGWVDAMRDHGQVLFIHLRDISGIVQIVIDSQKDKKLYEFAVQLKEEFIIEVTGKVRNRAKGTENPNLQTGKVEVVISEIKIHSASKNLPFKISEKAMVFGEENKHSPGRVEEEQRLKYRYLDLRRPSIQNRFIKRHQINKIIREYLDEKKFLELETPVLTRSTPEGARDYLVPSRIHRGKFYALPQSPQLFKQLFMMSGMEKYFQIVKCFRDEDLRPNRQPEFTQLDIEASFIDEEFIYELIEELLCKIFASNNIKLQSPFPRITYSESVNSYGTDAPDLRFDMKFKDVTKVFQDTNYTIFKNIIRQNGFVKGFCIKESTEKLTKNILQNEYALKMVPSWGAKGMSWMRVVNNRLDSNIVQFFNEDELNLLQKSFNADEGDVIVMVADTSLELINKILGRLRLHIAKRLNIIPQNKYSPVWITDFPMFEFVDDKVSPLHHPFTSPDRTDFDSENIEELLSLKSRAYDVVINGEELGGGSIRINDNSVQKKIFKALGLSEEEIEAKFGFFVRALEFGAPPHGGIALGLDRVVSMVLQTISIRDVIPFPKNRSAFCPLTEAPSGVDELQLLDLELSISGQDTKTKIHNGSQIIEEDITISKEKLTDDEVKKTAKLARLKLGENQLNEIKNDLNNVITYVSQLDELNTDKIKPMHHIIEMKNVWREDKIESSKIENEILENGPVTENKYFKVPKILED